MTTQTATKIEALETLRPGRQWVCFNETKEPFNPATGYGAKNNDLTTCTTYEEAIRAWKANQQKYKGVGRVFVKEQSITGIDLDGCRVDGKLSPYAEYVVKLLDSYTEISPSGRGLHIWVYGSLPSNLNVDLKEDEDKRIEAYDCKRYFTVTGNHLPGTLTTIEHRQEQLDALHKEVTARRQAAKQPHITKTPPAPTRQATIGDTPYGLAALEKECQTLATTQEGGRNHQLNTSAYSMGQLVAGHELTRSTVEQELSDAAARSGLNEREIEKTLRSGLEDGLQSPRSAPAKNTAPLSPFSVHTSASNGNGNGGSTNGRAEPPSVAEDPYRRGLTDLGNAERFADRYADTVRWCETWNTWLVFNGKCWEADKSGRVDQLAKVVVRSIYREVADEEDDEKRKLILKHAKASESNRAIRALLDRAKSELPATPEQFNVQLHLLNCNNGTLDLRSGELRPHNPQDFLTRCLKLDYNPLATCDRWNTFIHSILDGNRDLIAFIQEALGMSLSGDISEQCLFICHGTGSNGKTTMLETVRIIMAGYGLAANIETFQVRKQETVRNDIAELYGARLVTASENTMGSRLNEAFIKKATGKEPLRARRLHENEFEFMPELTLWLAVNHKPVVKDTTKGMWRRVHFIPFLKTFEEKDVDKHLGEKLLEEAEGILAWLVQGCIAWYSRGQLVIPQIVKEATQAYRAEMDLVGNFIANECDLSDKNAPTKTKELLERYEAWCKQLGENFNPKDLKRGLNERGYHSQRGTGGGYVYTGVRLKPTESLSTSEGESEGSEGSEGSEPKNRVISRDDETSQKIQNLPSPTFTTFTQPSPEKVIGKRCATCKRREATVWWPGEPPRCQQCQDKENERRAAQS